MATASLRERLRSARTFNRNRSENDEDVVHLDPNKDATENAYEILHNFCQKQSITDGRRVAYLNLFIKLLEDIKNGHLPFKMTKRDIICCLRVGLVNSNTAVRAWTLRVLRHCITEASDVLILNKLQIPYLISRSIDLVLKSDHERIQALRLSLKILSLAPKNFSMAVTRSLISLVNGINEQKDRMMFASLDLLCELCIMNSDLAIECSAEVCLLRSCLDVSQGRVNECLVGCLLFLLNKPETRNKINFQLEFLTSVYCDLQRVRETESTQFTCSRLSMLAALRTWTGVFHLCNPNNIMGMKAVISVLYLRDQELRKACVELLCDILGLELDETLLRDPVMALTIVDPSRPQDSWRLVEGFLVSEGKDILPHFADTRPNITEVHTALLVYSFLECGLLSALVEVVVDSDTYLSTQAVMLIGFLLHLCHKLVPSEIVDLCPTLPTLLQHATDVSPHRRMRAVMAVNTLQAIHPLLLARPVPSSQFLRRLMLRGASNKKPKVTSDIELDAKRFKGDTRKYKLLRSVASQVRETNLLSQRNPRDWDWDHISTILKCRSESFLRLEDIYHKTLVRKLVNFYKPSMNQYSLIEYSAKMNYSLNDQQYDVYTAASFNLLDMFLASPAESDSVKMVEELLIDICNELGRLVAGGSAHECLLSPSRVTTTLSQHYFLMLGHLTATEDGLQALERVRGLHTLLNLVNTTLHDIYIKITISSLCYSISPIARDILSRALTSSIENIRLYATELLLVHARAGAVQFHKWGFDLLIPQIKDESCVVTNALLDILHELCYDPVFLDRLIDMRPALLHLGDKGHLLLIRFLSTPSGFAFLSDSDFVSKELEKWEKGYNYKYVGLLEGGIHDSLTLHQRGENGRYTRRITNAKHRWKPVWVPPHLFGELSSHAAGFAVLESTPCLQRMVQKVQNGQCELDDEILDMKASLWALSNMATSQLGLEFLLERQLIQSIADVAQTSPVLTIRATAFYCLSLISTTEAGADALAQLEWYSVRHGRAMRGNSGNIIDRPRDPRPFSDYDITSSLGADLEESESVENLSQFLDCPLPHSPLSVPRASTLPPGLSGDFDRSEELLSPMSSSKKRHQRSYSETCSLLINNNTESPKRMSFQDAAGLATLQSLQIKGRPTITTDQTFLDLEQPRRFPANHRSSSPMTEFEAENPPRLFSPVSSASLAASASDGGRDKTASPVYCGICLPKALAQFFTIIERREERRRKRGSLSFSEMEQVKEIEEEKVASTSSSDWSEGEESQGQEVRRSRHNAALCLACCTRVTKGKRQRKISSSSFRLRTDTESSYGNTADGSPISLKWRLKAASEGGSGESFSCGEGDTEPLYAPPPVLSQTRVRRDVIKHVTRMCNPVWAKASLSALMHLKQSHQCVFQDVCLYSSVCYILSSSACRVSARRFVQEMFLDVAFPQFYEDAESTLSQYAPSSSSADVSSSIDQYGPLINDNVDDLVGSKLSCTGAISPTKNLSTVFENLPACSVQYRQPSSQSVKDDLPNT